MSEEMVIILVICCEKVSARTGTSSTTRAGKKNPTLGFRV